MWQSLERTGCLKNFFLWSNSQPSDDDFSGSLTGFEPTVWTEVTEVLKHSETLLKHSWNSLSFSLETLKWALQVQVCPSVLLSDVGRHLHVAANKHQLLHSCFHFSGFWHVQHLSSISNNLLLLRVMRSNEDLCYKLSTTFQHLHVFCSDGSAEIDDIPLHLIQCNP